MSETHVSVIYCLKNAWPKAVVKDMDWNGLAASGVPKAVIGMTLAVMQVRVPREQGSTWAGCADALPDLDG